VTTAAAELPLSFEGFLELEAATAHKHEYVDDCIYALAGAGRRHNRIAARIIGRLLGPAEAPGGDLMRVSHSSMRQRGVHNAMMRAPRCQSPVKARPGIDGAIAPSYPPRRSCDDCSVRRQGQCP
jgi:hypothetical protein